MNRSMWLFVIQKNYAISINVRNKSVTTLHLWIEIREVYTIR